MISKDMEKAINQQINREFFSAYLYLSMATYFAEQNLDGMAGFMQMQAKEEVEHGMKMYSYLEEQGARVILEAIEKPDSEFDGPLDIFEKSLKHEQFVTKNINNLVNQAIDEKDHATKSFLDWFVTEQVEEESSMDSIVNKLKIVGDKGHGLLMLDAQLGRRGE